MQIKITKKIKNLLFFSLFAIVSISAMIPFPEKVTRGMSDKAAHAVIFAVLFFWTDLIQKPNLIKTALLLFTYGFVIECIQYLIPYRSFSLLDMAANGAGILFYLFLKVLYSSIMTFSGSNRKKS